MAEETKITLEGLVVSSLAMTDALAKLMIAKDVITDDEFKAQLGAERVSRRAEVRSLIMAEQKTQ